MFSGKTEELIRRINRAKIAKQKVLLVKPSVDTRYHETNVVSHNENIAEAVTIKKSDELLKLAGEYKVIGIDEAQFLDEGIVTVVDLLANKGHRIILAGLDKDYLTKPFEPMPALMAKAEFVTKLHAICEVCGQIAAFTYRFNKDNEKVFLGSKDLYQARCRMHYHLNN